MRSGFRVHPLATTQFESRIAGLAEGGWCRSRLSYAIVIWGLLLSILRGRMACRSEIVPVVRTEGLYVRSFFFFLHFRDGLCVWLVYLFVFRFPLVRETLVRP